MNTEQLPPEVVEALARNEKIEAIKRLREIRGLGLKEAKDLIDPFVEHGEYPTTPLPHRAAGDENEIALPADVIHALQGHRKIDAIKRLRAARGIGLEEAKNIVDDFTAAPERYVAALGDTGSRTPTDTAGGRLPASVIAALERNRKIDAIKLLRAERDIGLKEAKELVDAFVLEAAASGVSQADGARTFPKAKRRHGRPLGTADSTSRTKTRGPQRSRKKTSATTIAGDSPRGLARVLLSVIVIGLLLVAAYWGYWFLLWLGR